jgi:hypothetical protein
VIRGKFMVDANSSQARKALVSLAIEKVLLDIGMPTYEEVSHKLYKDYHSYMPDCFENPDYLKRVLQDLYGKSSITMIESIKKQLEEYESQKGIDVFIAGISS